MMTPIVRGYRLLTTTMAFMAFVALLGWGAYAYSAHSSAMRDQQSDEAIGRITADRDALGIEQQRLVSERQRLVAEQQRLLSEYDRLQRELSLATAQLAAAREQVALLRPQQEASETGDNAVPTGEPQGKAGKNPTAGARARAKVGNGAAYEQRTVSPRLFANKPRRQDNSPRANPDQDL